METIEFLVNASVAGAYPEPVPAHLALPQWIKDQSNKSEGQSPGPGFPDNPTYKRCVPFMDIMRTGYIIPLWCDVVFSASTCDCGEADCPKMVMDVSWGRGIEGNKDLMPPIEKRSWESWGNIPDLATSVEGASFTFNNPWIIRTPPGYSTLFTQPFNDVTRPHPNIKLFTGLVNTDTYFNPTTFFFHIKEPFTGIMKRGTPLVQVVPVKREEWEHKIIPIASNDENDLQLRNERAYLSSSLENGYRERHGCPVRFT